MSIEFFGDTALEIFTVPDSKGTIILADGVPSNPASKIGMINQWNVRGYDIVFPRYLGTWESKSNFLVHAPQRELESLLLSLKKGVTFSNFQYKAEKIYLLGASFGGGVILSLKDSDNISKICALSPVISYKDIPNINTLPAYLKTQTPQNYRFEVSDFDRLLKDELASPINLYTLPSSKVLIIAGELDDQIPVQTIRDFSSKHSIQTHIDSDAGHITLSKLKPEHYELIVRFFSDKNVV